MGDYSAFAGTGSGADSRLTTTLAIRRRPESVRFGGGGQGGWMAIMGRDRPLDRALALQRITACLRRIEGSWSGHRKATAAFCSAAPSQPAHGLLWRPAPRRWLQGVIPAARRDDRYARGVGGAAARKINKIPAARRAEKTVSGSGR
jgi:hypothetical protein